MRDQVPGAVNVCRSQVREQLRAAEREAFMGRAASQRSTLQRRFRLDLVEISPQLTELQSRFDNVHEQVQAEFGHIQLFNDDVSERCVR